MTDNNARPRDDVKPQKLSDAATPSAANKNLPLGDRLRNLLEPAFEDASRKQNQLKMFDELFDGIASTMENHITRALQNIFNRAAQVEYSQDIAARNQFVIEQLTEHKGVAPAFRMELPIVTYFTEFSAQDITSLPGYIALHEKARELNIAIKLINVTSDEVKTPYGPQPAYLLIDTSKSYNEGALENSSLYPQLPEPKQSFDQISKSKFNF